MIKLMKYLKKSAGYIILIIALLFLQAYCDLSLPDYTSKIVNVGIQQSGIEDYEAVKEHAAQLKRSERHPWTAYNCLWMTTTKKP